MTKTKSTKPAKPSPAEKEPKVRHRTEAFELPEIEMDIPIPPPTRPGGALYRWEEMTPGDSRFFPALDGDDAIALKSRLKGSSANYARRHGGGFIARVTEKDGVKGVRIWRTGEPGETE